MVSYLPHRPNVGDLTFVQAAVDVIDNQSAIVKWQEQLGIVGLERRGTPVACYSVVITGVEQSIGRSWEAFASATTIR
jgi:hypothetical protein